MKFLASVVTLAAALSAAIGFTSAQSVIISQPINDTSICLGQDVTVMISQPNFQSSISGQFVAISFQSCDDDCDNADPSAGEFLVGWTDYNATLYPHEDYAYQNVTVTIPVDAECGASLLTVYHFGNLGASKEPWLELKSAAVDVVENEN